MTSDGYLEQWIGLSTPLPWGLALETETNTYRIVARMPDGRPRIAADGKQVVIARGLSHPDALILMGLREQYRGADKPQRSSPFLRVVE